LADHEPRRFGSRSADARRAQVCVQRFVDPLVLDKHLAEVIPRERVLRPESNEPPSTLLRGAKVPEP
jgi:hypothetical protein